MLLTAAAKDWPETEVTVVRLKFLNESGAWPALVNAWQHDSTVKPGKPEHKLKAAVQSLLLAIFGKLNYVWADKQLRELMMQLPLEPLQLLLCSDKLQVDNEDIVLYTAVQYIKTHDSGSADPLLTATLVDVIRCPYLTTWHLAAVTLSSGIHMLHQHKEQLQRLLMLRLIGGDTASAAAASLRLKSDAKTPPCWLLPGRPYCPVLPPSIVNVNVTWHVNSSDLIVACNRCCEQNNWQIIEGPATSSPVAGATFALEIKVKPVGCASIGNCNLGVYFKLIDVPVGATASVKGDVTAQAPKVGSDDMNFLRKSMHNATTSEVASGWIDFFCLGALTADSKFEDWGSHLQLELVVRDVRGSTVTATL